MILILAILQFPALCQEVIGTVVNERQEPIGDVTVTLLEGKSKTYTNQNGEFKIVVDNLLDTLHFSGSHVESLKIAIENRNHIHVHMLTKFNKLDEVQIIGYGTTTQRYNVGSVTKLSAGDIAKTTVSNPLLALQGRVPGLTVSTTSGLPGAAIKIQIRGQNTLSPDPFGTQPWDNPLYIIDGVPYAPQNTNINQYVSIAQPGGGIMNNAYGGVSPFNSISPESIESIEVLRDADATAIYGSRGGNGVILITTKKGKVGKTQADISMKQGISFIGRTMPMMNTAEYLEMRREAFVNDQVEPVLTRNSNQFGADLLIFDETAYTDWKDVFFGEKALNTKFNLTFSGGNESTQFLLGGNFNRDTYVFPGNLADQRIGLMNNFNHSSRNKRFTLNFSMQYTHSGNSSSGNPDLLKAYQRAPNYPDPYLPDGSLRWEYDGFNFDDARLFNPYAYLQNRYHIKNTMLNSNVVLSYMIADGLRIKTSTGCNRFLSEEKTALPEIAQNPNNFQRRSASFGDTEFFSWILEPQITYNRKISKGEMNLLAGATLQHDGNQGTSIYAYGFAHDRLMESISTAPNTTATDNNSEYKYAAFFGRVNFVWDKRYILNLNGRRDGSSRFGPDRKSGSFGSLGVGWIFADQALSLPLISHGKIHGSFGISGSDATSPYQYIARWAPTYLPYEGELGYTPQNLFNADLSWAKTQKFEFGLEIGLLKDRLIFNGTWYRHRSGNQLINYTLPSQTGFNSVPLNWDAMVQNSGVEMIMYATAINSEGFTWNASLNLTIPKNKLLKFPNIESSSYATTYTVGQSLSTIYGFRYAGVDSESGFFQFYNAQGDITQSPTRPQAGEFKDYVNIGNLDPKFYGGLQNTLRWNQFVLDVFVEYKKQMGQNYLGQIYLSPVGGPFNVPKTLLNRWKAPGDVADFEKYTLQSGSNSSGRNFTRSSGVYSDASYIRLKNIHLAYHLPHEWLKNKLRIADLQATLSAQNMITLTKYKGNDPETQSFFGVPPLKTIVFGLKLSF